LANGTVAAGTILFAFMKHTVAQPAKSNGITWHASSQGGNALRAVIESNGLQAGGWTGRRPSVGLQMSFLASVVLVIKTKPNQVMEIDWVRIEQRDLSWASST